MKYIYPTAKFVAVFFVLASALPIGDARSQGVYEQLKQSEAGPSVSQMQAPASAKEVCLRADRHIQCRMHYLADSYKVAWRGTVPVHDGGVVEVLVRGDAGALCSDAHEVGDYSFCFNLSVVK